MDVFFLCNPDGRAVIRLSGNCRTLEIIFVRLSPSPEYVMTTTERIWNLGGLWAGLAFSIVAGFGVSSVMVLASPVCWVGLERCRG